MATLTKFFPAPDQQDVPRTTLVSFNVLDDAYGVQIATLKVSVGGDVVVNGGVFVNGFSGSIIPGADRFVVAIHGRAPEFLPGASEIEVSMSVLDAYGVTDAYDYSFYTVGYNPVPPEPIPSPPTRACLVGKPYFISNNAGLRAALDEGVGTEVELRWNEAAPYDDDNMVVYNIYHATRRVDVFEGRPKLLVAALSATIGGLPPGDTHFFGMRAAELDPAVSNLNGLRPAGPDTYWYPSTGLDGYLEDTATIVPVDSVEGFPEMGIALVDDELIRYLSLRQYPPALLTDAEGRGYEGTVAESHQDSSQLILYWGHEDGNTIIAQATPSFQKPNWALTWVKGDGYGPDGYRDGYDGYDADGYDGYYFHRQVKRDDITTDGSNNDASGDFPRFDYCGSYRGLSPAQLWQGQCVPSYFGGLQQRNGVFVRETDVRDHMLQREEVLLETTGEPFVLMRRLWTGIRCSCHMLRREHADQRCPNCYGTGFVNGYEQFFNPRRTDSRILVRVDPATEDLLIEDKGGLTPKYEPGSWTMAFPAVKDRDVLVRFNADGTEEFRYEILDVTRVRALFGQSGVQKFNMKRFHRTDIIYQFPVTRTTAPYADSIVTSVASGPGLPAHSHTIILPHGGSIASLTGSTSVDERHHHVIRKGKLIPVLGHTHSMTG